MRSEDRAPCEPGLQWALALGSHGVPLAPALGARAQGLSRISLWGVEPARPVWHDFEIISSAKIL